MGSVRQPLDVNATLVVAKESLVYGPKRYVRGETIPLRDLGCTDLEIWHLWNGQDIDCVAATTPIAAPVPQSQPSQPSKPPQQQPRRGR